MIFRLSLLLGALLLVGFSEPKPATKAFDPMEAAQQGRALVAGILSQRPAQNLTNTGVLKIRDGQGRRIEIAVDFVLSVTESNWWAVYSTRVPTKEHYAAVTIVHSESGPNHYTIPNVSRPPNDTNDILRLSGNQIFGSFAGSDFFMADLGIEFFYWPEQKLLKSELRKSRLCRVLESINPQPAPGAYSRVVSWIDDESLGIIHAEAYDFQNKLLKEFDAKKIKKVKGEWQLEEMEISNVQTGSRTQIEFNFDAKQFNEKSSGE
jgi:hypothetical protein